MADDAAKATRRVACSDKRQGCSSDKRQGWRDQPKAPTDVQAPGKPSAEPSRVTRGEPSAETSRVTRGEPSAEPSRVTRGEPSGSVEGTSLVGKGRGVTSRGLLFRILRLVVEASGRRHDGS